MAKLGILALQGDFEAHGKILEKLGLTHNTSFDLLPVNSFSYIKKASELKGLSGLIIPGGESTTLLKLLDPEFRAEIKSFVSSGLPLFVTCAGLIIVAKNVLSPAQESLELLNVTVERNAYGRQVDSFFSDEIVLTEIGVDLFSSHIKDILEESTSDILQKASQQSSAATQKISGAFIRAPRIRDIGQSVQVLARHQEEPVFVKQNNIWAATFHPELVENSEGIYQRIFEINITN